MYKHVTSRPAYQRNTALGYHPAFSRVIDDVSLACLTQPDLSDAGTLVLANLQSALEHAAGRPNDMAWVQAFSSLRVFLKLCREAAPSIKMRQLEALLSENVDLLPPEESAVTEWPHLLHLPDADVVAHGLI